MLLFLIAHILFALTINGDAYKYILQELVDCLRCLKPKKITPTVSVSKGDEQVELLLNEL